MKTTRFAVLGGILVGLVLFVGHALPTGARAQDDVRCFPETGYCISGPIRAYWEANGGLPVFGYPITDQRVETIEDWTGPVQWFERDRLEDHGNQGGVMAGRLGARLLELRWRPWQSFPQPAQVSSQCMFFSQTQHSLCEPFLSHWYNNGGLERFGYPITEAFDTEIEGQMLTVQYFERRRMELHTGLSGSPVLLGLLGNEVYQQLEPSRSFNYPACQGSVIATLQEAYKQIETPIVLGCPILVPQIEISGATQQFERGKMIWFDPGPSGPGPLAALPPTIFAIVEPELRVKSVTDYWNADTDPETPNVTPPADGLYAPWRGFGKLWQEDPELRAAIGWATEPEAQSRAIDYQHFMGGIIVRVHQEHTVYVFRDWKHSLPPHVQIIPITQERER
jgi:hypothetical protein